MRCGFEIDEGYVRPLYLPHCPLTQSPSPPWQGRPWLTTAARTRESESKQDASLLGDTVRVVNLQKSHTPPAVQSGSVHSLSTSSGHWVLGVAPMSRHWTHVPRLPTEPSVSHSSFGLIVHCPLLLHSTHCPIALRQTPLLVGSVDGFWRHAKSSASLPALHKRRG